MSTDVCTVACNLPAGMICEVGLRLNYATSTFERTDKYKSVRLAGSQRKMLIALPPGVQAVATRDLEPGLTHNVSRDFITQWLAEHPRMKGHIWIVEQPKSRELQHQVGDRPAPPFEPVDPKAPFKFGGPDNKVEPAKFDE